jgi:hypothetical protein
MADKYEAPLAKMRREARAKPKAKPKPSGNALENLMRDIGITGYLKRQGQMAQQGLAQADEGAQQLRNANPWGALNMPMGAVNYLASPINALLPTGDEIDAANLSPEARRFLTAVTASMMAIGPGGKGPRGINSTRPGLGRGLGDITGTQAEQAALKARLEAEAAQGGLTPAEVAEVQKVLRETSRPGEGGPGGILSTIPGRIRNPRETAPQAGGGAGDTFSPAVGAPTWNPEALKTKYAAMSRDELLTEAAKRGGTIGRADALSAPKLRQALFSDDVSMERTKNELKMVEESLKKDPTVWK